MTKQAVIESCGETLAMHSDIDWVDALLQEGNDGAAVAGHSGSTVAIPVEAAGSSFPLRGLTPLTRAGWRGSGEAGFAAVCGRGFDIRVKTSGARARFTLRTRPS